MKRNHLLLGPLVMTFLACAAPVTAQDAVDLAPGERAALEQLERDPRFTAMAEEKADLKRLENEPQTRRATEAWHEASSEAMRLHLRSVAARGDPQSLLAAAMLWPERIKMDGHATGNPATPSQEKRVWFDAARRARPRNPLVAWVEASDCSGLTDRCDPRGALQFLLQIDPNNAAVQLLAFANAEREGDAKAADRYWAAAAASDGYDPHTLDVGQLLHATGRGAVLPPLDARVAKLMGRSLGLGHDATPDDLRDIAAMGVWSALAIPAFQPVVRKCGSAAQGGFTAQTQTQCERVMTLLAGDQSLLIAQMIGLSKMVELTVATPAGSAWRERLREFRWIYENALRRVPGGAHADSATPADYLRWVLTEGEMVAMQRLLQLSGVAPLPPAGWLPEDPRYRALVTSGRAPPG